MALKPIDTVFCRPLLFFLPYPRPYFGGTGMTGVSEGGGGKKPPPEKTRTKNGRAKNWYGEPVFTPTKNKKVRAVGRLYTAAGRHNSGRELDTRRLCTAALPLCRFGLWVKPALVWCPRILEGFDAAIELLVDLRDPIPRRKEGFRYMRIEMVPRSLLNESQGLGLAHDGFVRPL